MRGAMFRAEVEPMPENPPHRVPLTGLYKVVIYEGGERFVRKGELPYGIIKEPSTTLFEFIANKLEREWDARYRYVRQFARVVFSRISERNQHLQYDFLYLC